MEIRTYRARTIHDALALVRQELGPSATVVHSREVRGPAPWGWLPGHREIEVTALRGTVAGDPIVRQPGNLEAPGIVPSRGACERAELLADVRRQLAEMRAMLSELCHRESSAGADPHGVRGEMIWKTTERPTVERPIIGAGVDAH
jgi:flagellar biosynthesis GTPase FlhF